MSAPSILFHVSDLHFGAEDRAALDWFAGQVVQHRPHAVICTGDLTMRARTREFVAAAQYLGALPAPLAVLPGNHDMPYFNPVERFVRPYARYSAVQRAAGPEPELDGIAIIPLRTITPAQWRFNWAKGRVGDSALDTALASLAAARDAGLRLVICHHPLIEADTRTTGSTRGGKRALAALARAGADAVLSGHVHDAFDRIADAGGLPIRIIGAGTLSQRLRATTPSYNRLEWSSASGLQVTVQSLA